jgi:hypothetical protein
LQGDITGGLLGDFAIACDLLSGLRATLASWESLRSAMRASRATLIA